MDSSSKQDAFSRVIDPDTQKRRIGYIRRDGKFIATYQLIAASSVKTSINKLIDNELVYHTEKGYIIYDRFMNEWLKRL